MESFMRRRYSFDVGFLVVAVLFIPGAGARAALLDGVGAIGSSTSDEYQFSALHPTARNWVEILATQHSWNFGSFSTVSRGEPRNQGYEYDWGRVGATTGGLLTQGQHTGLAAQVASGDVTLAFLWIGTNDFRNVLNAATPPASLPPTLVPDAVSKFTTALNTILSADPKVKVVVATTYDEAVLPYVRKRLAAGQLSQSLVDQVSAGIHAYNTQITATANADQRVDVTDLFGLLHDVMAPPQFSVGGLSMDRITSSPQPEHFYVDDMHPGTIGQGLIANAFIDTINTRFSAGAPRLSDAEIFNVAGVVPEPTSVAALLLAASSAAFSRQRRWAKRSCRDRTRPDNCRKPELPSRDS
jgi:phospholipase/lecithinase/hemolysin